jgi:CheY-like chemotaxis protein
MRMLRHLDPGLPAAAGGGDGAPVHRFNLLLSYAGWDADPWVERLPRLLDPMGVRSLHAGSGREATEVIERHPVHVAVVDLGLPFESPGDGDSGDAPADEGGPRLLHLLARLDTPPPTLVIKRRRSARDDRREIAAALRAGAFAVLDRPREPADVELVLKLLQRVLRRHYADRWPDTA